jgi:hypothetical protein
VTGKGGSSKGKAKKRRARQEEESTRRRSWPRRSRPRRRSHPRMRITSRRLRRLVGEHEADDTSGDTIGSVYQQGRARLPERPIPVAQRLLIKPEGTW